MIYIFDKTQSIIKVLTNDDFTAAHLNFKINTATTFEFSLPASKALPSGSKYVATPHPLNDSKFIMLRLTERVDNTETIDYSAYELAYQELATDGYIEDKRPQNQSALNLMKIALDGSNWELNNVNVSGAATTNFYYVDRLSAISKVVDLLGGEIVFYIEIQGNTISGRYMDYLARQGADTSKVFASGSNLLTVERQSDTSGIYTAILPRGKGEEIDNGEADTPDGYGRRINIADAVWKKSAGEPLDKPKGSIVLSDPDATAEWGQINGNARLLLQTYDDIDDVNVLINSAYKTLQSVNHPQIQYSATVADVGELSLGDTVLIMHGDRDLSYKTRVFEVKYNLLSPDQTELSLGDDLSSNSITSQINSFNAIADTTSSQTQWTINQIGRTSTTYGATAPDSPKVGDIWFKYLPDGGTEIYRWNGDIWELLASPTTADDIATAVDDAVAKAQSMDAALNQSINNSINATMTTVNDSLATLDSEAAAFKSEADSATSSVASSVSALMTTTSASLAAQGSNAVSTANQALANASSVAVSAASANSTANSNATKALSQASSTATSVATAASIANSNATKAVTSAGTAITNANTALSSASSALATANASSLATSSVASDVSGLKANYTSLNSSAGVLSSQTASLAVSASSASAQFDKVSSSTDSLASDTANLKVSASSAALSIGSVQSSAGSLASDAASLKVSASSAALSVSNLTSSAGSLSTKTASLAVSASSFATAVTSMSTENGSQATALSSLVQRADGFDLTVSKVNNLSVGGRNLYINTTQVQGYVSGSNGTIVPQNSTNKEMVSDYIAVLPNTQYTFQSWGSLLSGQQYWAGIGQYDLNKGFLNRTPGVYTAPAATSDVPMDYEETIFTTGGNTYFVRVSSRTFGNNKIKFEKGNVATDWSPAPEDIDAVTGSLASDTSSLKLSASSAALDISHVASSAGSLAADTASLKVSASSAALSISSTQSTASSTATQATSLAVSASSAAVEISNVKSSAGSLSAETSSLKLSASSAALSIGNVQSSAGSLATETAALKVSASSASAEFTKVNSSAGSLATQAASLAVSASSAAIGISNVTSSAGSLATQTASLAVSASSFSTSITSMASQNGSQATAISALTQRADGFDMTVAKVDDITDGIGGRNWLLNTTTPRTIAGSNAVNYTNTNSYFNLPTGVTTGSLYNSWGLNSKFVVSFDWSITGSTIGGTFIPQFNGAPWGVGGTNTTVSSTNNKGHIVVYGTVTSAWSGTTAIRLSLREDSLQGSLVISNMKMEQGTVPTAWTPAPEDIDQQFATQKITIDGITSTVSKQTSDIDAVTTRVQTAEGSITTATNNITGLQSSQTQTANQLQIEVTDRATGDSNTLTQAKSFTTSQITSYNTGIQSQFTQTTNAILGKISSTNLFPNSEFTKNYGYRLLNGSSALSLGVKNSIDGRYNGTVSVTSTSAGYQGYWARDIPVYGGKKYSASVLVHYTNGGLTNGLAVLDIWFMDISGARISSPNSNVENVTSQVSSPYWVKLYAEGFVAPVNAVSMEVSLLVNGAGAGQTATFTQPMVTATEKLQEYSPNDDISAQLSLMKDNYSFGINANGQLVSGIMGNEKQVTLAGKAINLDGNTTVTGDFYALGGNFKNLNASEIKTGTINASLINVINLNASNITTGAINGANLTINLDTGQVVFQKGRIYSADGRMDINIDSGYISTANSSTRILLTNGQMQFVDPTIFSQSDTPYFKISNDSGIFNGSGALVSGKDTLTLGLIGKDMVDLGDSETFYGINLQSKTHMRIGGANQGLYLSGGATFADSTTLSGKNHPYIFVGSDSYGGTSNGDRIYISSRYMHSPAVYQRTNSASANVYVASDGALVRSSSASRFKLNIKYETDASTAEQLLTLNPATWDDKFETEQTNRLHETGEETDIAINKRRYYGIIAEDLVKANLDYLVQRNEQTNEVDGVEYAKIGVALIPIVRELRDRINEQALEIERLKEITK